MKAAAEAGVAVDDAALRRADLSGVSAIAADITVAKKIAEFPRVIAIAAKAGEPHRIAFYLYELASAFHALYNKGGEKAHAHLKFLQTDGAATMSRLALARSVTIVISAGLGILGVRPVEKM